MDHVTHNQGCVHQHGLISTTPQSGTLEQTHGLPPTPMTLGLDEIMGQGTKGVLVFVGWSTPTAQSAGVTCL